jgi:hypothetical protein
MERTKLRSSAVPGAELWEIEDLLNRGYRETFSGKTAEFSNKYGLLGQTYSFSATCLNSSLVFFP